MKVLVCGSRQWTDWESIEKRLCMLPAGTTIISGAARGVDGIAAAIGRKLGLEVREFPAEWNKFGAIGGIQAESSHAGTGHGSCHRFPCGQQPWDGPRNRARKKTENSC